ncbi:MAG TPA: response regulator [Kiritimatiellia bacterium]|nr:response regulator [Kiritimatiellia bacterium]
MNAPVDTVHIIDDDASFRKSVERLLRVRGYPTESFESADAFLRGGVSGRAGCILLDVHMPGLDGLALQQALARTRCTMPVIFLTGRGDIPMSVRAIKAGAADFLTKPVDDEVLLAALRKAFAEGARRRAEQAMQDAVRERVHTLTERELDVLRHLLTGALNKQIGGSLDIAEKTVKVHRGRVMEKMGVTSVAELVRLCALVDIQPAHTTKVP